MRTAMAVLATSVVLVSFSEALYYDTTEPAPALALWYLLPTAAFVWAMRRFTVSSLAGLLVAGAIYGFVVEGVLVTVLYEQPVFTVSYTSLAWHMLCSVLVGFWLMGSALRHPDWWRLPLVIVGVGVLLGVWWRAWPARDPVVLAAGLIEPTLWLASGHAILGLLPLPTTPPSRLLTGATGAAVLGVFAIGPLLAVPWSPALLGPLLALCLYALRADPADVSVFERLRAPIRLNRLGWLLLLPAVTVVVYAVARPLRPESAQAVVGGTQLALGYLVLAWASARLITRRHVRPWATAQPLR